MLPLEVSFLQLEPGTTLGPYRLISKLGQGGMGVVWKAHDPGLARDVAIKILPESLVTDPERVARFDREAKVLASLNHPHIATIYGFQTVEDMRFLTMEIVDGVELNKRIQRGRIPVQEVILTARQIAEALESAHEKGVIHRDLKPSNIMVKSNGDVKVLDFGLAKALVASHQEDGLSLASTITQLTKPNVILGTVGYMSPEQASGSAMDKRTDIWSFGVILFEMLTGQRLFHGKSTSEVVAAVLISPIDWDLLPSSTPTRLRDLLRRCLTRDARHRLRDMGDARIMLEELEHDQADEETERTPGSRTKLKLIVPWAGTALLIGIMAGWMVSSGRPRRAQLPLRRFVVAGVDSAGNAPSSPAISPDGQYVAFVRAGRIWVQNLKTSQTQELETLRSHNAAPDYLFWSPDARDVGYVTGRKVLKVSLTRGENQVVQESSSLCESAVFEKNGSVLYTTLKNNGLLPVYSAGPTPGLVLNADTTQGEAGFSHLSALPNGRGVLMIVAGAYNDAICVFANGTRKEILKLKSQPLGSPFYSPSGHILFERAHGIWAIPFSLSSLSTRGESFLVVPEASRPTVAADGSLVYLGSSEGGGEQLVWMDRSGNVIEKVGPPDQNLESLFEISPDQSTIAISEGSGISGDIFLMDLHGGNKRPLTFEGSRSRNPSWSADGRRVVYLFYKESVPNGGLILSRAADGSDSPDTLAGADAYPALSPDGQYVLASSHWVPNGEADLMAFSTQQGKDVLIAGGKSNQLFGRVSPRGDLLAYVSDEETGWEVFVTRFPSARGRWQVSTHGGWGPRWNARGDRLYFSSGDAIYEATIRLEGPPVTESPRELFRISRTAGGQRRSFPTRVNFDVTRDGQRFLVLASSGSPQPPTVNFVQNWATEFTGKRP